MQKNTHSMNIGYHKCRYCTFCFEADDYRCSNHPNGEQPHWSEQQIKKLNHCKNFALSDLGDIITGKQFIPRKRKQKKQNDSFEQLSFI